MARKTVSLPSPANPNIEQVLQEFLAEQKRRLKPATFSKYDSVIDLFRDHLNGYAYDGLSGAESALFEKHYNADGSEHREFCELFGPDKIVENFKGFLGYFMIRKVMGGAGLKRDAATVTKKLSQWLAEKGYTSGEAALDGVMESAAAARDLPRAERAARILAVQTRRAALDPNTLNDDDYQDFDHYTIVRIEPGKFWWTPSRAVSLSVPFSSLKKRPLSCARAGISAALWDGFAASGESWRWAMSIRTDGVSGSGANRPKHCRMRAGEIFSAEDYRLVLETENYKSRLLLSAAYRTSGI